MKVSKTMVTLCLVMSAVPLESSAQKNRIKMPEENTTPVLSGVLVIDGKNATEHDKKITASKKRQSAVLVINNGKLVLTGTVITKKGDSSDPDQSNFIGMNAAVLATSSGTVALDDVQIMTDAEGANAVFATGSTSEITVHDITIYTKGNSSRGLDATYGGTINAFGVDITTEGAHCAAVATDRGEGIVTVNGGTMKTAGDGSPLIYSTGDIRVTNVKGKATGSEIAVVEGKNSITINNCDLSGAGTQGILLYQSFSGDSGTGTSVFTASDSKFTSVSSGPFFYVTNTDAQAALNGCTLSYRSGILVCVSGNNGERGWGRAGSNGGSFKLTAHDQALSGDIVCDKISSMDFVLAANAQYTGAVDTAAEGCVSFTMEKSAVWNVTRDSYIASLRDTDVTLGNIKSNGHTVYYDRNDSVNELFDSRTIVLSDGGKLAPYTPQRVAVSEENDRTMPEDGVMSQPGGPDQMKSYAGVITVKGKDKAVFFTVDGILYQVSVPDMKKDPSDQQPPDMKHAGGLGMGGGNRPAEPGRSGNPPPGGVERKQMPEPVTLKELRKCNGKKVVCQGFIQKNHNGADSFVVFSVHKDEK